MAVIGKDVESESRCSITPFQKYADAVLSARCECRTEEGVWGVGQVAVHLALALARDNPRFDFARFFVACGFGQGKEFPDDTPLPDSIGEDGAVGARWVTVRRDIPEGARPQDSGGPQRGKTCGHAHLSDIGRKIRALRRERGLSQRQLAGREMTRSFISMLECGRIMPSERTLRILALRLRKPVGFFRRPSPKEDADVVHTLFGGASKKPEIGRLDDAIAVLEQVVEACRGAYLLAEARFLLATLRGTDKHAG